MEKYKRKISLFLQDSDNSYLLKNSSVTFIIRVSGSMFNFLFSYLIAKKFGADGVGSFSFVVAFLFVLGFIAKGGLDTAALKFISKQIALDNYNYSIAYFFRIIKIFLVFSFSVSLLFLISSDTVINTFSAKTNLSQEDVLLITFSILPFGLIYILSETLKAIGKIKEFAFIQQFSIYFFSCLSIVLAHDLLDIRLKPAAIFCVAIFITSCFGLVLVLKHYKIFSAKNTDTKPAYSEIVNFSLPVLLVNSMDLISGYTHIFLLSYFLGEAETGIFSIIQRIAVVSILPLQAINAISAPKFAEFHAKNKKQAIQEIAGKSIKMILVISIPVFLIMMVFPELILSFFGEEFIVGVWALVLVGLGQFINAAMGPVGQILQMTENEKVLRNIILVSTIMNITLGFVLIPEYGILGAAFAMMSATIFWNVAAFIYLKFKVDINIYYWLFKK